MRTLSNNLRKIRNLVVVLFQWLILLPFDLFVVISNKQLVISAFKGQWLKGSVASVAEVGAVLMVSLFLAGELPDVAGMSGADVEDVVELALSSCLFIIVLFVMFAIVMII